MKLKRETLVKIRELFEELKAQNALALMMVTEANESQDQGVPEKNLSAIGKQASLFTSCTSFIHTGELISYAQRENATVGALIEHAYRTQQYEHSITDLINLDSEIDREDDTPLLDKDIDDDDDDEDSLAEFEDLEDSDDEDDDDSDGDDESDPQFFLDIPIEDDSIEQITTH
jgi:hypothetical protein